MDLNQSQLLTEAIQNKWAPIIDHKDLTPIKDRYRKTVTTILLENLQQSLLNEAAPANAVGSYTDTGGVAKWDPILISMARRALPNLIAYDVCGVQPMGLPTGQIFALRARYSTQNGTEALFKEANTMFSNASSATQNDNPTLQDYDNDPAVTPADPFFSDLDSTAGTAGSNIGHGLATADGEALGTTGGTAIPQMAFSIEKATVTAKTRALKAMYTAELMEDMKTVHGLNAEDELANILGNEILAEINREVVRTIYNVAKLGCQKDTTTAGVFDLNTDSNGRWSVEKFKGLLFAIERDANMIAKETRRGKGNIVITTSDVASALSMAGILDYAPALQTNLNVDDTGNTFAGTIGGKMKVFIDPYFTATTNEFYCVGYKGTSPYDSGLFFAPYIPMQMFRAVDPLSFQPAISFRTRYGLVSNPFVLTASNTPDGENMTRRLNQYYRISKVTNLL
jgi:hypothetical protein